MEQVRWGHSDGASELGMQWWSKKDKDTVMKQTIQVWNGRARKPGRRESKVPWAQDLSPDWDVNGLVAQTAAAKAETWQSSWCNCGMSIFFQA